MSRSTLTRTQRCGMPDVGGRDSSYRGQEARHEHCLDAFGVQAEPLALAPQLRDLHGLVPLLGPRLVLARLRRLRPCCLRLRFRPCRLRLRRLGCGSAALPLLARRPPRALRWLCLRRVARRRRCRSRRLLRLYLLCRSLRLLLLVVLVVRVADQRCLQERSETSETARPVAGQRCRWRLCGRNRAARHAVRRLPLRQPERDVRVVETAVRP